MIVVSDTSPLNYLVLIGADHLLPKLFGQVIAPPIVLSEMQCGESASAGSILGQQSATMVGNPIAENRAKYGALGPGESAAIALAQEV